MVERNSSEDTKSASPKVQIPEVAEESKGVQQAATAASTIDVENDESDEENNDLEERKILPAVPRKVVDQSKSNIPIPTPDLEDFKELLQTNAAKLKLSAKEIQFLEMGLMTGKFKSCANITMA